MTQMTTIETRSGRVRGTTSPHDPSIRVFRGMPFAAPPVGDLRWRPPEPEATWRGERDATRFSASATQPQNSSAFVWRRGSFPVSEDCLYLNVWSPEGAAGLPVMVWFHGGAHTSGQGHAAIFDGTALAQEGVVVVTVNYRLALLGFLAHPWLAEESPDGAAGNYGLLDKIAALEWVRDNITAFGGDPNRVTVFGQSAGSQSICSLMVSPLASGLFHQAIGQSAACFGRLPTGDLDGMERGIRLVEATGARDLEALRRMAPEAIDAVSLETGWASRDRVVVDGLVVPELQASRYQQGKQADIPLMVGSLANEGLYLIPKNDDLTDAALDEWLERTAGRHAVRLRSLYADESDSPGAIQHAIATDTFMAFGMRRWAEYNVARGNPTWLYFMDHRPPAFHLYMPEAPDLDDEGDVRRFGAYHSADLAYVFGTTDKVGNDFGPQDHAFSAMLVRYWTNFAKTGDPNDPGLPAWPAFTDERKQTQVLREEGTSAVDGVRREKLDLIAETLA